MSGEVFNGQRLQVTSADYNGPAGHAIVRGVTTISYKPNIPGKYVNAGDKIVVDGVERLVLTVDMSDAIPGYRLLSIGDA